MTVVQDIAQKFIEARRQGIALTAYPGVYPVDLESAYLIQDAEIDGWDDIVAAWKVASVSPDLQHSLRLTELSAPFSPDLSGTLERSLRRFPSLQAARLQSKLNLCARFVTSRTPREQSGTFARRPI